jgi:hypothetical protein
MSIGIDLPLFITCHGNGCCSLLSSIFDHYSIFFATGSYRCPLSDICLRDIVVYKEILLHTTWHCCKVSHVVGVPRRLFILNNNKVLE